MTNGVTVSNFINSELYKIESLNRGQTVTIGCVNLSPSTRQGQGLVCERGYFHDESRQQEYQRQGQVALQQRQLMQQEEQLRRQEEQRQQQIVEQECLLMLNCEIKPLVNVQPVYPRRAAQRGIQGWAVVSFTVTETGGVRDVIVVDAEPKDVFNQASIKAAEQFRYQPRYVDGVAVEVSNVRYEFRFNVYVEN